jgi:hypothetical protein
MKAIPAGGLDVPLSAPNWIDCQPVGSVTFSDNGELVTSVPATVRVVAPWPELATGDEIAADDGGTGDEEAADDGATEAGGRADAGAVAAGLQAVPATTIAAAPTTNLMVLFTD